MPKHRPTEALRSLGARMRSRRLHLGLTREAVAKAAGISVTQLALYESGQGHPPAYTLQRISGVLGTLTSSLLGEPVNENAKRVDALLLQVYSHPDVDDVVLSMREMDKEDRRSMKIIAKAFAARHRNIDRAHPNQTEPVR